MAKLLLTFLLGIAMICSMPIALSATVSGKYYCTGYDPTSSKPNFKENFIVKSGGPVFKIELYELNSALPYYVGTGVADKNNANVYSFVFWDPTKPDNKFVESVYVNSDGSFNGVFAYANKVVSGTESCKRTQ